MKDVKKIKKTMRIYAKALSYVLCLGLAACGHGGSGGTPAAAPTVTLTATPSSIAAGAGASLVWSSTNATTCTASDGWSGTEAASGSHSVGPLTATTTYTLSCTGPGGTTMQSVRVVVVAPPAVSLVASPTLIAAGASTTLTWSATNATSCTASGAWSGSEPTSGSSPFIPTTFPASYTLACAGTGGSTSATATVIAGNPIAVIDAPPAVVAYSTVGLDGTNSGDTTASLQSYAWKQTAGPAVVLTGAGTAQATFTAPQVTTQTTLTFSLTVTDSAKATSTANVSIAVSPATAAQLAVSFVSARMLRAIANNPHTDYAPADGPPLAGSASTIQVTLTGAVQSPLFTLVDGNGNALGTLALTQSGTAAIQPLTFFGPLTVPSVPFKVSASGTTADGHSYSVQSPSAFTPMNLSISFSPSHLFLAAGAAGAGQLTIYNGGAAATFSIQYSDPQGLLSSSPAASVQIAASSSATIPIAVKFPPATSTAIGPALTATASVSGDGTRVGSATLTLWQDGTQ
jgi:uncharacterized cupredoxin-like copper-binding protein